MEGIDPADSAAALYAYRLRKERERTGATQVDAAAAGQISVSLFGHYETMRRIPTMDASVRFDEFFSLREYFSDLQPLVINEVGTANSAVGNYLDFFEQEAQASSLRFYQPQLVPGLFQTEQYARAILSRGTGAHRLERAMATRLGRQQILLKYADGDDLAYTEAAGNMGRVTARPSDLHTLELLFDRVRSSANSEEESMRLIRKVMDSISNRLT